MSKSLFGYGLTTKAIAKSGGWEIFDDKFKEKSVDEFGNILLPPSEFDPTKSELEIPSPGFNKDHFLIKNAKNLTSEYDYFKEKMAFSIYITGTNGKTTTTKMCEFLLKDFGAEMGGNVGIPLALMPQNTKIYILETSSFTLHYTNEAMPNIFVLLPITPDHLSWHGSMQSYIDAKLKPLAKMKEGSVAIVPKEFENYKTNAKIISYENEFDLAQKLNINIEKISFKTPFLLDAVMALACQKIIFDRCDIDKLNQFVIEPNKLEEFSDKIGRIWVNDTKATNIDAALQALKRYENKHIHLILGGDDKGVELDAVYQKAKELNSSIYAIGSNTDKIMQKCKEFGLKSTRCEFLKVAVEEISKNLNKDEIALLSPACASLDQFSSYAQRGDDFKNFVKNLEI